MPVFLYSSASVVIPTVGDKECNKTPEAGQIQTKAFKKKKRSRNRKNAEHASSDQMVTQNNTSHVQPSNEKQCLIPQHMSIQTSCNHSTQTEIPENMPLYQATQTLSLENIQTKPTELKSTQTQHAQLSFKQLYENQVSVSDQSRNPEHLTVLTWNIDGLDPEDVRERIRNLLFQLGK